MPKPTLEELESTALVKPSFEDLEGTVTFRAPVLDPNEEAKKFTKTIDNADKLNISLPDSEDYHDSLENIEKKKPIGFWEGLTEDALFKIPISGPMLEGLDLARIKLAAIRLNTPDFDWDEEAGREKRRLDWEYGKPGLVSKMDRQEYLDSRKAITAESAKQDDIDGVTGYITVMAEREERGYNTWGRIGQGLSVLPAWMFEFALTGGLYRSGSAPVKKLLQKHAKSKLLAKTGGWIAGSAVRTTVGMPQRTFANTMRRSLNQDEGWATSIAKGWGETFIEVASEQAGQTITGGLSYVASGAINKMPFGSKFLSALQKSWVKLSPDNTAAKFAKKIITKGGYSNLIGEYGEERLATLLHGIAGTETFGLPEGADTFDRVLAGIKQDLQLTNALSEVVVLSVPGAIKVSVGQLGKFANDSMLRKAIETKIGVSPEAAKKAVEIKNGEGGVEEADKYLSDVKTVGEKAADKVIAEAETPPTEAIPAPQQAIQPQKPAEGLELPPKPVEAQPVAKAEGKEKDWLNVGYTKPTAKSMVILDEAIEHAEGHPGPGGLYPWSVTLTKEATAKLKPAPTYWAEKKGSMIGGVKPESFDNLRKQGYRIVKRPVTQIIITNATELHKVAKQWQEPAQPPAQVKGKETRDILGGVDPINQIHIALKSAKAVQPLTKKQKKAELRRRVGRAAGAMKSNVKKGVPTEEAVFKSTGLLKGPLAEYDQVYTSVEDILEPGAKEAAYQKIYNHPELRYFETLNTTTSFKKLLAGAALTPGDVENIERVFGKTFEDVTTERQTKSGLYERIITIWKAGLLTGIKTSGLNTLSNVSHAITETAKDIPATFVDSVTSLFTGERTLAFTARGMPGGIEEGFVRGWKYLKTGLDVRNVGIKLDYKKVYFGKSKIAKGLQAYEETIFHLLGAEDQPFYYGAKARSLYSQAIAQAINKKLKGTARQAYVDNAIQNPTDEMLEYSVHDAEIAVYQNRTKLGDIAKAIQKVKGGEVIVPFGRTPSAVATQILNYSPIGYVKAVAESINEGVFDQRKFSQAFGRATVGTGALYIGTLLFTKGLISLDYPDNERERELWKLTGRKPNSIKIGDKWRDVQVLGPVGNVLIIGGHFQKALDNTGSPSQAMIQAMSGGAKSFTEQTFVRGVNLTVDAITDPERSFERWFTSMSGSVVPTIVADIARAMDEQERRTKGPIERIQSRIPILREGLEPKVDVFGQDLPRYGGNVLETMIDPTRPSKIRQDVVVDELRRLFNKDIKVSPTLLGDKDGYDILSKEENTQLWRRSGEITYKILLGLVTGERYKQADDFSKGKMIEIVTNQSKKIVKAEIVNIKLGQGVSVMKLAESGLLSIDSLEMLKYYSLIKEER